MMMYKRSQAILGHLRSQEISNGKNAFQVSEFSPSVPQSHRYGACKHAMVTARQGYFILNNDHCPRIHGCDGNQVLTEVYVWLSMWGISVHAGTAQFTAQMLSLSHLNAILSDDAAFIKSFASYTSTNWEALLMLTRIPLMCRYFHPFGVDGHARSIRDALLTLLNENV